MIFPPVLSILHILHIDCPICVKICIRSLHKMVLTICEFPAYLHMEAVRFFGPNLYVFRYIAFGTRLISIIPLSTML